MLIWNYVSLVSPSCVSSWSLFTLSCLTVFSKMCTKAVHANGLIVTWIISSPHPSMLLRCYTTDPAALHSITSDLLDLLKIFAWGLQHGSPFPSDSWCAGYVFPRTGQGSNFGSLCSAEVTTSSDKPLRKQQPRLTDWPGCKEGSSGQVNPASHPVSGLKRPNCCAGLSGPTVKFKGIVKV